MYLYFQQTKRIKQETLQFCTNKCRKFKPSPDEEQKGMKKSQVEIGSAKAQGSFKWTGKKITYGEH